MMADDINQQEDEQTSASVSVGQRLREARDARGLSVDEVSHDLHLDRDVIFALESDDFESLGAPVFVKGYLRSYARMLGLPESDVAEVLVVPEPEPEEFRTLSTHRELKAGANLVNFVLWVALGLIALIGAAYLLLDDNPAAPGEIDKGEFVTPEVSQPVMVEPAEPDIELEIEPAPEPEIVEVIPAPKSQPEAQPEPEPVLPEPATMKLTLNFTKECWVEVSDSRKRLIYGLEKSSSSVSVEGVPPFKLFLGNVSAVEVLLNDQAYDVPGRRSGRKTARFVIEADELPGASE